MRYVYLVKKADLMGSGRFEFHRTEVFSSLKMAKKEVENILEINKATNVEREEMNFHGSIANVMITYDSISVSGNECRLRLVLEKKILR